MISGSDLPPARAAFRYAQDYTSDKTCTIVASKMTASPPEAALINGMLAPVGTPPEIVALLQKNIAEIVKLPDVKATFDKLSFVAAGSTPDQFGAQIKQDIAVWGKVMKDAHIPVN